MHMHTEKIIRTKIYTINIHLSNAMAVMERVETKTETKKVPTVSFFKNFTLTK
jgi:hypothetical protein